MALAIDTSTPAFTNASNAVSTGTSAAFNPPAGTYIAMVCCISGSSSTTAQTVSSMTDNLGSHLAWSRLVASNTVAASLQNCVEIWGASCPSAQTSMTVTATFGQVTGAFTNPNSLLLPVVFAGQAASPKGSTQTFSTTSGVPSVTLTGTTAGSYVVMGVSNWTNGTAPTVPAGQTTTINGHSAQNLNTSDGDGWWAQMTSATIAGGSVTMNDTGPTASAYNVAAVEILAGTTSSSIFIPGRMPLGC